MQNLVHFIQLKIYWSKQKIWSKILVKSYNSVVEHTLIAHKELKPALTQSLRRALKLGTTVVELGAIMVTMQSL